MSGVVKFQNALGVFCLTAAVLTTVWSHSLTITHAFFRGAAFSVLLGALMWLNVKLVGSRGGILGWPYFVGLFLLIFLQPSGYVSLIAYGGAAVGGAIIFKRILLLLFRKSQPEPFNSPHPE